MQYTEPNLPSKFNTPPSSSETINLATKQESPSVRPEKKQPVSIAANLAKKRKVVIGINNFPWKPTSIATGSLKPFTEGMEPIKPLNETSGAAYQEMPKVSPMGIEIKFSPGLSEKEKNNAMSQLVYTLNQQLETAELDINFGYGIKGNVAIIYYFSRSNQTTNGNLEFTNQTIIIDSTATEKIKEEMKKIYNGI
jgi:hypothetical protein